VLELPSKEYEKYNKSLINTFKGMFIGNNGKGNNRFSIFSKKDTFKDLLEIYEGYLKNIVININLILILNNKYNRKHSS